MFYKEVVLMNKNLIVAALMPFLLTLTACGGGGDDGGGNQPPSNKAPTANAGVDKTIDEGSGIALSGSGTDTDGTISSYSWTQASGDSVTINNSTSGSASFNVTTATQVTLTFRLTVTDNDGVTDTDTVNFTVNPVNLAPTLASIEDKVTYQDTSIEISLAASDSNNDPLTFNASLSNNANFNIEIADEVLRVTPINKYFGNEIITVIVSDGELEDSADFTLQVLQISVPPVAAIVTSELSTPPPMPTL